MSSKGLHGDNIRFLDAFGKFPTKPPELGMEPDYQVMLRICNKLRNTKHLKMLYHEYPDDGNQAAWMEVQELRWRMQVSYAKPETLTIRPILRPGDVTNPGAYVGRVLRAADLALAAGCGNVPLWFELGNEPNLIGEGFHGDPGEFNAWFIAVTDGLRAAGFNHGYFYPGLSPYPGYLGWYNDETTRIALDHAQGIALHAYNEIKETTLAAVAHLDSIGYGHYPRLLSEAGSLLSDRMVEFGKLNSLPVIAYHIFIVDGKPGGAWDPKYILTAAECAALEQL